MTDSRSNAPEDSEEAPSFSSLYAAVAPALYTWAELRLRRPLRQYFDPEDLVQEVCVRSFARFATFDPERGVFRAWLFGIANNVLREMLTNSTRRRSVQPSPTSDRSPDSLPDDITSVSRRVCRNERLQAFANSLETLEPEEQKLVLYRGLEGMKHPEVAELLNVSQRAVEKRWQRLVKKIEGLHPPDRLILP